MKSVRILGKSIPLFVMVLLLAGLGSAALLTYYGTITGKVTVAQSVLLDGKSWPDSQVIDKISESEPAPIGGECFCSPHSVKNQASVPAGISFATTYSPLLTDSEIVTTELSKMNELIHVTGGNVLADITKIWNCGDVSWDVSILSDNPAGHTYGIGLVISDDHVTPDFQVWYAEAGNIPSGYTEKDWYYQAYPWSNPAVKCTGGTCPNGIKVTSKTPEGKTFHIEIPYKLLNRCGGTFYWAMQLRTNLITWYGTYDWGTSASGFVVNHVGTPITTPLILKPGETKDFCNCYDFAIKIAPATYTITTDIVPQ
jgi:hypothetical protein